MPSRASHKRSDRTLACHAWIEKHRSHKWGAWVPVPSFITNDLGFEALHGHGWRVGPWVNSWSALGIVVVLPQILSVATTMLPATS